jgi:hypothetical protein
MIKDPGSEDFGFGLSDGMYEKGVVKYSLYTVILGETDPVRLFKKIKIFM